MREGQPQLNVAEFGGRVLAHLAVSSMTAAWRGSEFVSTLSSFVYFPGLVSNVCAAVLKLLRLEFASVDRAVTRQGVVNQLPRQRCMRMLCLWMLVAVFGYIWRDSSVDQLWLTLCDLALRTRLYIAVDDFAYPSAHELQHDCVARGAATGSDHPGWGPLRANAHGAIPGAQDGEPTCCLGSCQSHPIT